MTVVVDVVDDDVEVVDEVVEVEVDVDDEVDVTGVVVVVISDVVVVVDVSVVVVDGASVVGGGAVVVGRCGTVVVVVVVRAGGMNGGTSTVPVGDVGDGTRMGEGTNTGSSGGFGVVGISTPVAVVKMEGVGPLVGVSRCSEARGVALARAVICSPSTSVGAAVGNDGSRFTGDGIPRTFVFGAVCRFTTGVVTVTISAIASMTQPVTVTIQVTASSRRRARGETRLIRDWPRS